MQLPEWMEVKTEVQVNLDTVREEWALAWMGIVGTIERIDAFGEHPCVVTFPGEAGWFHFRPDELMQPVAKIPRPNLPEYVRITRVEYDELHKDANLWRTYLAMLDEVIADKE